MTDGRALVRVPLLAPSPLARYRTDAERRRELLDGLALVADGGVGPDYNYALVFGELPVERLFELADRFFAPGGYAIIVESEMAPELEERLRQRDWEMDEEEPAMLLAPIPEPPPALTGLNIQLVTDQRGFDDFMLRLPWLRRWVPSLDAALDPDVALFVGYVEGEPVAAGRLTCIEGVGEVTSIETLEGHRRRGIGTAMTWAAVSEAARRGCIAIALTATEMGYPVYLRMGFRPVCFYRTYLRSD
jgi:GNAT superfamily N-acetyltransferase